MWPPTPLDHLVADPHRRVRAIIRANQRAEMGWSARMVQACAPLVLAVVLIPWIRPVFLHFLEAEDPSSEGLFGILIRMGIVLIGWGAIGTYGVLVRSPEREVLAILPVDAGRVALEACDEHLQACLVEAGVGVDPAIPERLGGDLADEVLGSSAEPLRHGRCPELLVELRAGRPDGQVLQPCPKRVALQLDGWLPVWRDLGRGVSVAVLHLGLSPLSEAVTGA